MKHDGDIVYPLYMTKRRNDDSIINLLMITKEDNNSHYTLIKDLNVFLRKPNDHHTKVFVHTAAMDTAQNAMVKQTWPSIVCDVGLMVHKEQSIFLKVKILFNSRNLKKCRKFHFASMLILKLSM